MRRLARAGKADRDRVRSGVEPVPARKPGRAGTQPERPAAPRLLPSQSRAGSLEDQARLAARRILDGYDDVGTTLGRATPARFAVPSSAGEPLSPGLRATLEARFGADLGAVRIHRDAPAAASAAAEGARAYAAGTHIAFAAGEYRPGTSAGFELLAHEVAHVLQQTARRGWDGRLRAVPISGRGEIQKAETPAELYSRVERLHSAGASRATRDAIRAIGRRVGNEIRRDTATTATGTIERETLAEQHDNLPRAARAFLMDILKLHGRYAGAAHLLDKDGTLRTVELVRAFYDWIVDPANGYGPAWANPLLPEHPLLREFWPARVEWVLHRYLMNPGSAIQVIPVLRETRTRLQAESDDPEQLTDNERVYLGLNTLLTVEAAINAALTEVEGRINRDTGAKSRLAAASHLAIWAPLPTTRQLNDNEQWIRDELQSLINGVAEQARDFWSQGLLEFRTAAQALMRIGLDPTAEARAAAHHPPPDDPAVTALRAGIEAHAAALFQLVRGDPPTPALYAARVREFTRAVQRLERGISGALWRAFRSTTDPDAAMERAREFARLLFWAEELRFRLADYDRQADDQNVTRFQLPDIRLGHRIRMARLLYYWSLETGWTALEDRARRVLMHEGLTGSRVVLLQDWEREPNVRPSAMIDDFGPDEPVFENTPLTPRHVATFFEAEYLRSLNDALEVELDTEETNLDPTAEDPLAVARRFADSVPMPERWQVTNLEWIRRPDDDRPDRRLVRDHPKTQALIHDYVAGNPGHGYALTTQPHRILIWLVPDTDPMVEILRESPFLDRVVRAAGHTNPEDLSNTDWLAALLVEPGQLRAVIRESTRLLRETHEAERTRQRPLLRRLGTLRRRRIAAWAAGQLQQYATGRIQAWSQPNDVLHQIERYSFSVQPETDQDAQVAALVLELAPALRTAFVRDVWFSTVVEERYDLITGYYALLTRARDFVQTDGENRLRPVLHADESAATLVGNASILSEIISAFDVVRQRRQQRFGFKSENGRTLASLNYPFEIQPNQPFDIDGVTYRLVEVHERFVYHPPYGKDTGAELASVLKRPDGTVLQRTGRLLITINVDNADEDTLITDRDELWLERLSHVVEMQGFVQSMENLAEIIETAADVGMIALSFVPGVGQAVTVGHVLASAAQFVANDLPAIREELMNEPFEIVGRIRDHLDAQLTPDKLILYLLFGGTGPVSRLAQRPDDRRRRRPRRRGKLGRLIAAVRGIEERFRRSIGAARRRMEGPYLAARSNILARPRVAFALGELADLYPGLQSLATAERLEFFEALLDDPAELAETIGGMIEALNEIELPNEVIPLELAVEVILGFFLDRFGARGRLLRAALERIGVLNEIADPIADALRNSPVDPNQLWRDWVLPKLQVVFTQARDGFVQQLYEILDQAVAGLPNAPSNLVRPSLPAIEFTEEPFPESDLLASDEDGGFVGPMPRFDATAGAPLPQGIRAAAEERFGHDFGHVRLHTGADAAAATHAAAADGIATGSHVFLRPGLGPGSARGREVLDHELAHVLQATGPRPLGEVHDATPSVGRAHAGVRYEPRRESAAEAMANAAARRGSGAPPVQVREPGDDEPAPSMTDVAIRVLREFGAREAGAQLIRRASQPIGSLPQEARDRGTAIVDEVLGAIASTTSPANVRGHRIRVDWAGPLGNTADENTLRPAVRAWLSTRSSNITSLTGGLVSIALEETRRPARGAGGAGGTGARPRRFSARRFATLLSGVIMARTGLGVGISLDRQGHVDRVRLHSLDPAMLAPNSRVWILVRDNTRQAHRELSNRDLSAIYKKLSILRVGKLWETAPFRLHPDFVRAYLASKTLARGVSIPTWNIYKDTDPTRNTDKVGLRVGTHGQLKDLDRRTARNDRHSHHIPQFLLVQYFHNRNRSTRLLGYDAAQAEKNLPGFEPSSSEHPERFVSSAGTIPIKALYGESESERARPLPAVLLAADTHVRGKLHLNTAPSWGSAAAEEPAEELSGSRNQSDTLHRYFLDRLRAELDVGSSRPEDAAAAARANPDRAKVAIYRSMKQTYAWMYDDVMKPPLERALKTLELAYYTGLAAQQHGDDTGRVPPDYDPGTGTGWVTNIMRKVQEMNDRVMAGWK